MLQQLTEEEIILFEVLCHPRGFSETLFSNMDNLSEIEIEKEVFLEIRMFQETWQNFSYCVGEDPLEDKKQNYLRRINAGQCYNLGARNLGKSCVHLFLDILQAIVFCWNTDGMLGSPDAKRIRKVFDGFIPTITYHPLFIGLQRSYTKTPQYIFIAINGFKIVGINEDVANAKKAGSSYHSYHCELYWYEEYSKTSYTAQRKAADAVKDTGILPRFSGMTDCTKFSCTGDIIFSKALEDKVVNIPQTFNRNFDEALKQQRILDYKGEKTAAYRINVLGQIIEDGLSVLDIELVRKNYKKDKETKLIEVDKENYFNYENLLIFDKPKDCKLAIIGADIGEASRTEIVIVFGNDEQKYKYRYNVVLRGLIHTQQIEIFSNIIEKLEADYVGIDCTSADGRVIYRDLAVKYGDKHFVEYNGNKKIVVGFEKDQNGKPKIENGNLVVKEEKMRNWAVQVLKDLFYDEGKIEIPERDMKFDEAINSIVAVKSAGGFIYESTLGKDDHFLDAWIVFAITLFTHQFSSTNPIRKKKFCKTGI